MSKILSILMAVVLGVVCTASAFGVEPVAIKPVSEINTGDTAWMLTSAALVLMMTGPGLALFYSGLVRRKNVLGTMMQSFILMAAVSVVWAIVGYSLAFDTGNPIIGGFRFAFLREVGAGPCEYAPTIPHTTWAVYQAMFAIITPALICGAYAERMKFSSMLFFSILWLLGVYCPLAHMVWGKGGLLNDGMYKTLDFAGGVVVHLSSGISALVCALYLGKRRGFGKYPMPPHSVVLATVGAALLWVGWFGFNGGSAGASGAKASNAFMVTHLAGAAAAMTWLFIEWLKIGKPTVLGAISGAVAGLAMVTPASGFTTPMYGMVIGVVAGGSCFFGAMILKQKMGYDDSLDAFGVHGISGILGTILAGVFAVKSVNDYSGLVEGNTTQFIHQIVTVIGVSIASAAMSVVFLKVTELLGDMRMSETEEWDGMDLSQHGESGYVFEEEGFASAFKLTASVDVPASTVAVPQETPAV